MAAGTRRRSRSILKALRPLLLACASSTVIASAGEAPEASAPSVSAARHGLRQFGVEAPGYGADAVSTRFFGIIAVKIDLRLE